MSVRGAGAVSAGRTSGRRGKENRKKAAREQRLLLQFLVCVLLFLTVFVGKGVFPERIRQVEQDFLVLLDRDTDFRAALSELGTSLSGQDSVLKGLGTFCVEVFGTNQQAAVPVLHVRGIQVEEEQRFFNSRPDRAQFTAHLFRAEQLPEEWFAAEEAAQPQAEPAVPAVGTVVMQADYRGKALPEGYTMDQLSLGDLQTVVPVMGNLWSGYGYRDHPIDGQYKFHNGVDLGAEHGTAIAAFASGTVEYIGENDVHGLYMQIDHGNGIKSFYAHCSKLCAGKGTQVAAGEKIGEVGETGSATGPHLHFELKYKDTHLNPAYYITYAVPR